MNTKYDVVVIGAGIGGLVCGAYLARAGMKVLIVEKHIKPGGYCTSFNRDGYHFDVGVHYLGSCRNGGVVDKLLRDLDIKDALRLTRSDPTDTIIMPDRVTRIRKNPYDTIAEFQKSFPNERENIAKFFEFIMNGNFVDLYKRTSQLTFTDILEKFFKDDRLKATLTALLLNIGVPPSSVSALTVAILFREYVLDSGYYPKGGMQVFPDLLAAKVRDFGGEVQCNTTVTKIVTRNNHVKAVQLSDSEEIKSDYIVANADATSVFSKLLDITCKKEFKKMNHLKPSPAIFAIHVGLTDDFKNKAKARLKDFSNIWYFSTYNTASCLADVDENIFKEEASYCICTFPSAHSGFTKNTMSIFMLAPFKDELFWNDYKTQLSTKLKKRLDCLLPFFSNCIKQETIATPITYYRYTSNYRGAAYGWSSENHATTFPVQTSVGGLFLVGHWCSMRGNVGGIPSVVYSGMKTAELIVKSQKIPKEA